jgi:hypothetical protein
VKGKSLEQLGDWQQPLSAAHEVRDTPETGYVTMHWVQAMQQCTGGLCGRIRHLALS